MEEHINECPNPFCKLPMTVLKLHKKPHEWHCLACGTSVEHSTGKRHFKRDVERHIEQGHAGDESGYVVTKEGKDVDNTE